MKVQKENQGVTVIAKSPSQRDNNKSVQFKNTNFNISDDSYPLKEFTSSKEISIYTSVVSMAKYGSNEPIDVVVCNSSSPSSFHVYIRKFQNELLMFQKNLHKSYACYNAEQFSSFPPVNSVCVAYNKKDKTYYRARVTSSDHSNGRLQG